MSDNYKVGDMVQVSLVKSGGTRFILDGPHRGKNYIFIQYITVPIDCVDNHPHDNRIVFQVLVPNGYDLCCEGSRWNIWKGFFTVKTSVTKSVHVHVQNEDEKPEWKKWAEHLRSVDMPKDGNSGFDLI